MKKTSLTLLLAICFLAGFSQLNNNGGTITVQTGAVLVVEGNYTSTGSIEIDGTVQLKGNLTNNIGGSMATGSTGLLDLNGTATQNLGGTATNTTYYCKVKVTNTAGVTLGADQVMDSTLDLTGGKVTLGAYDLTLSDEGTANATSSTYLVTDGDGRVIAPVPTSGNMLFPVGYDASNYAPITLANADVNDEVAVQVKDGLLDNCGTGTPITNDVVTLRWNVDNSVGTVTDCDMTMQFAAAEQDATFDGTDCSIIHCNAGVYDPVGGFGATSGTDPKTFSGTNISDFGWLGIGDGAFGSILVNAKVFLQGPYNGTNMNTDLRTANYVPTSQPYSATEFNGTHLDYNGTESNTSLPSNVVDWVLLELRTSTTPGTSIDTAAALLLSDGSIVAASGSGDVPFKGIAPGSYHIVIHHRNHLSVMSNSTVSLARTSSSVYDFTSALSQAYDNPSVLTNDAMANLGTVYGLFQADGSLDKKVSYTADNNDKLEILDVVSYTTPSNTVNGYYTADYNMNGTVSYTADNNDKLEILDVVSYTVPSNTVSTHVPY